MGLRHAARLSVLGACLCSAQAVWSDIKFVQRDVGLNYPCGLSEFIAVAVADLDGDGWPDVLITGDSLSGTRVFRNNHDKTFSDVTSIMFPFGVPNASGAILADMTNDGWPDLVLAKHYTEVGSDVGFAYYRNIGGSFIEIPMPPDFLRSKTQFGGMTVGDFNGDRWLDILFLPNQDSGHAVFGSGDGSFSDATSLFPAILTPHQYWSSAWADFNGDGLPDLHIAIDHDKDMQFRNLGHGQFKDVSLEAGVTHVGSDMGLAIGDFDNDGDFDIFSTNIAFHVLYVNDGHGVFTDMSGTYGCKSNGGGLEEAWGTAFADFDHDGHLDLVYNAMGATGSLLQNDGTGHFVDVTDSVGCTPLLGTGLVVFDFDNDGDLDMLTVGDLGQPVFCENVSDHKNYHWLEIAARGTEGNRDSVGAIARITAGDLHMMRPFSNADSYLTSHPSDVHFGLGTATTCDVTVSWPTGSSVTLTGVAADQRIVVTEPVCGDANRDGKVDIYDITFILLHLFQDNYGDVNGDGVTDLFDLNIALINFGHGC